MILPSIPVLVARFSSQRDRKGNTDPGTPRCRRSAPTQESRGHGRGDRERTGGSFGDKVTKAPVLVSNQYPMLANVEEDSVLTNIAWSFSDPRPRPYLPLSTPLESKRSH